MVFVLIGGIMSIGAGMTQPFFNVYLLSIGAAPSQIGLIFAGASIFAAFTTLFSPRLVEWFGSERAVAFGRVSPVPFFILLMLAPGVGLATLAHLVRTASQGLGWSVESAYMSVALRGRARRAVFGYRSGTWNVGFALTSLLGGIIIVRWGYHPTFAVYALSMTIAMTLFYIYARYISPVGDSRPQPDPPAPEPLPEVAEQPVLRPRGRA
jgi:MFS family permease